MKMFLFVCLFSIFSTYAMHEVSLTEIFPKEIIVEILFHTVNIDDNTYAGLRSANKNYKNLVLTCKLFHNLLSEIKFGGAFTERDDSQNLVSVPVQMTIPEFLIRANGICKKANGPYLEAFGEDQEAKSEMIGLCGPDCNNYTCLTLILFVSSPNIGMPGVFELRKWTPPDLSKEIFGQLHYSYCDPNKKNDNGNAPLYYAIRNRNCEPQVIQALIEQFNTSTADIDNKNRNALAVAQAFAQEVKDDEQEYPVALEKINILQKYVN
jgi:hypothetical protein